LQPQSQSSAFNNEGLRDDAQGSRQRSVAQTYLPRPDYAYADLPSHQTTGAPVAASSSGQPFPGGAPLRPLPVADAPTNGAGDAESPPAASSASQAFPSQEMVAQMLAQNSQLQKTVTSLVAALVAKSTAPSMQSGYALDAMSSGHGSAYAGGAAMMATADPRYASGAWGYASEEQLRAASQQWSGYYMGSAPVEGYGMQRGYGSGDRGSHARAPRAARVGCCTRVCVTRSRRRHTWSMARRRAWWLRPWPQSQSRTLAQL
jgi:hypothetical protein